VIHNRVVIAQWACSGLGARSEKVGRVQWHWIQTLVPLSQFQSPLLLSRSTTRRSASGLRATTMCTACVSLLASTSASGAASGASWAIASSYSGTRRGQGLSGVGTRNPDGLWYIERVRAMERKININRDREICRHKKTYTAYAVASVLRWWVAVDAPADSDEAHVRSRDYVGVFRTQEDALQPGWHEWETNFQAGQLGASDWRSTGLNCETTAL